VASEQSSNSGISHGFTQASGRGADSHYERRRSTGSVRHEASICPRMDSGIAQTCNSSYRAAVASGGQMVALSEGAARGRRTLQGAITPLDGTLRSRPE
jgi:hypothetical protein